MFTFVNIHIHSYITDTPVTEAIQRVVLHTVDNLPDRESLNYHIDLLMEDMDIDTYSLHYEHDSTEPCTVAKFVLDGEQCCVRVSPCLCRTVKEVKSLVDAIRQ